MISKPEWQSKVYKANIETTPEKANKLEFKILHKAILKRDGNRCKACFKSRKELLRENKFLTVHHILPREKGGTNDEYNLLTLCTECHDKVEEMNLKSKPEIYGLFSKDKRGYMYKGNIGIRWQQWVYGGFKKSDLMKEGLRTDGLGVLKI